MRLLPILLLFAGCAAPGSPPPYEQSDELARELTDRVAGPPERCVFAASNEGLTPVDSRTLVLRRGSVLWVNHLADRCPGMRPLTTLIVESKSGAYCRNDLVRAIEPGSAIPGPNCRIGDFTPYRKP